jgi:ABC-type uncharacterized transport system substrate-binding protein
LPAWARPGGNVTGVSVQAPDLAGKRLELLRELVPGLRGVAILANVGYPAAVLEMREAEAAARAFGLEVVRLEVRRAEDNRLLYDVAYRLFPKDFDLVVRACLQLRRMIAQAS